MKLKDQFLLEQTYGIVVLEGSIAVLLEQYKQELIQEGMMDFISTKIHDVATFSLTDQLGLFGSNLADLAKHVVVGGALSSVGVYVIGSLLKILGTKRQEASKLTTETVLSIATANSKKQLEELANQYETADEQRKKQIVAQQNQALKDSIEKTTNQLEGEKKSSVLTNLLTSLGGLMQSNSFILGLLVQVVLSYFGIITFPKLY